MEWFGTPSNLHKVWDEQLIEAENWSSCRLSRAATAAEVATWQQSTVLDWVHEAMHLRPQVYAIGDGQLGSA